MDRWTRIVDNLIGEIIGDGDISHLPGAGKPLVLHDDCHTPSDQRAAFKILQDHEVLPAWIASGKSLELNEARLRKEVEARALRYLNTMRSAKSVQIRTIEAGWSRYMVDFFERVERHNRDVLIQNLKVPSGIPHQAILNGDILLKHALKSYKRMS